MISLTTNYIAIRLREFFNFVNSNDIVPSSEVITGYFNTSSCELKLIVELYTFYNYEPNKKTMVRNSFVNELKPLVLKKMPDYLNREKKIEAPSL